MNSSSSAKPSRARRRRWQPSAVTGHLRTAPRELLQAPELSGEEGLAAYYGLVDGLDAAIDAAISNAYLAQAMRSLRVHRSGSAAWRGRRRRLAPPPSTAIAEAILARDCRARPPRHACAPAQSFDKPRHLDKSATSWSRNTTSAFTRARKTCPARTSSPRRSPRSPPIPSRSPTTSPTW